MKEIPLTRGKVAIIDDEDYALVSGYRWNLSSQGYPVRSRLAGESGSSTQYLARLVMGEPVGMQVDHISMDKLDNRKQNLRIVTQQQNRCNRRAHKNNTSGIKGVSWHRANKKWMAAIKTNYKQKYLGQFSTKEEAAAAYAAAAVEIQGEYARL